jgi:protein TonB
LPPLAGENGAPSSRALTVLLLDREQAAPSRQAVPAMPRPPPRPVTAASPAGPPISVTSLPSPAPPALRETGQSMRMPAASAAPQEALRSADEAPTHATATASEGQSEPGMVSLSAGRDARHEQQRYLQDLMAWLARHRLYPDAARKARLQGIVHVRFTLDRQGQLLAAAVDRGPGIDLLEQAAMQVLQRANPMPPIPDSMGISKLTLTLPIEYSLHSD